MTDLINKIPAQKTGTEFLVASHFTISHEDRWAPSKDPLVYKSTFKKDYPPLPLTKRERIPSPSPATIMHKDDRYNDKCSMTRGHFVGKNPEKQNYANSTSTLTKTNFKMDSDRQLKSFQTTHKEYYPVRPLDEARNPAATGKKDWMSSYIPQGDKEKELWPHSDYRSKFLGKQLSKKDVLAPIDRNEGPPTITGDARTHHMGQFTTTTKSEFVGRYLPKQQLLNPALRDRGSSIPQGDQEKCNYSTSTQQESFRRPTIKELSAFDRGEAVNNLRRTTFQLGDRRVPGHLGTTAAESYPVRIMTATDRNMSANLDMGKSSFPEGDRDPLRAHERVSVTTNDIFYGKPAIGFRNKIVDGSHLRTESHVDLGAARGAQFYETSMKSDFTAVSAPYKKADPGMTTSSSIPLDYYKGAPVTMPTSWSDFPSRAGVPKLIPNPLAVDNLKKSHIRPPIPEEREFSTTHQSTYTPKKTSRRSVNSGSLQRSSIPLGTLNTYV